jgi:hypothetical protein
VRKNKKAGPTIAGLWLGSPSRSHDPFRKILRPPGGMRVYPIILARTRAKKRVPRISFLFTSGERVRRGLRAECCFKLQGVPIFFFDFRPRGADSRVREPGDQSSQRWKKWPPNTIPICGYDRTRKIPSRLLGYFRGAVHREGPAGLRFTPSHDINQPSIANYCLIIRSPMRLADARARDGKRDMLAGCTRHPIKSLLCDPGILIRYHLTG